MIKILSWNIRQGGGSRIAKIISTIRKSEAQIITLNEFRNNKSGTRLRTELLNLGYRHQMVTNANADTNSVIIASIFPFDSKLFPHSDPNYSQNIACASFDAFDVYGVYFPHKKKHRLFGFLQEHLPYQPPSIITGDFNSGINGIDQKGQSFWYESEFKSLSTIGYQDAFRHKNGSIEEYSWYSHHGNGFRYDHTFVHEDLLPIVKNCFYTHDLRQEGISDHSAMYLLLG
jgi:exonuclease III